MYLYDIHVYMFTYFFKYKIICVLFLTNFWMSGNKGGVPKLLQRSEQ